MSANGDSRLSPSRRVTTSTTATPSNAIARTKSKTAAWCSRAVTPDFGNVALTGVEGVYRTTKADSLAFAIISNRLDTAVAVRGELSVEDFYGRGFRMPLQCKLEGRQGVMKLPGMERGDGTGTVHLRERMGWNGDSPPPGADGTGTVHLRERAQGLLTPTPE